jgi:hypothetical protein
MMDAQLRTDRQTDMKASGGGGEETKMDRLTAEHNIYSATKIF